MNMITEWSQRYQAGLGKYLDQGVHSKTEPAIKLGQRAAELGLEPLDLALIHKQALMTLVPPNSTAQKNQHLIDKAKRFFARTIVPIENTHRAALKANVHVNQLARTLRRRTKESIASERRLERGIAQRQAAEAALKKSGHHRIQLLQESSRLKTRLRTQTREILSAQESERRKTSLQLHDEIAQTLVAINLRLLTLKKAAKANTATFEKEIAQTQRLVRESIKPIHRLAHEFGLIHET